MTIGLRFLHSRPIGVLASIGDGGYPHAVPVELVVHEGCVYTWCRADARRVRFLHARPVAAITAYRGNDYACARGAVRIFGTQWDGYPVVSAMFLEKYERTETYGNDTLVELDPVSVIVRVSG